MPIRRTLDVPGELLEAFDRCCLVTEYLIGVLPPRCWRALPPGRDGRHIAAITAHMQSVRRTFAKMGGADPDLPSLDAKTSTPAEARRALGRSRAALTRLFQEALAAGRGRVKGMPRRTVDMMCYLMQHEAHHRGQISTLARELGHEFQKEDLTRIWGWRKMESS